jgi:ATP-dependent RNA helicase DHX29
LALQKGKGLDVNAPAFIPKMPSTPKVFADDEETIKSRILETYNEASDSDFEHSEFDNLTIEYVRLRLRYENLASNRRSTSINDELSMLRARLDAITENYLFDEKEAKAHYRSEREKADSSALQKKLESSLPPIHESPLQKKHSQILQLVPSAPQVAATDVFADDDSSDSVGGVLDFLDDVSSTEINVPGGTFSLRNMALPKHWSGRTPKTLLHDSVAKADRYAAISYNIISGHSRARRASVAILWEGKKRDEWSMEDVACPDDGQAEQYISTVALHALSFPLTDGFAAGTPITSHNHTFFRLLPAVYRGLWEDLEAARKIRDDSINRSIWAKLRTIIEGKLEGSVKVRSLRCIQKHNAD